MWKARKTIRLFFALSTNLGNRWKIDSGEQAIPSDFHIPSARGYDCYDE